MEFVFKPLNHLIAIGPRLDGKILHIKDGHFLTKMTNVFHWIRSTIVKGERGLMKSSRKTHILYASREGRPSNLTQCLVHDIIPKAFMGWALILMLMAIFLVARESLIGWSSGLLPIRSIICIFG